MDNDIGRSAYNVARTQWILYQALQADREGYQGLDRKPGLSGGADSSDPESMRFDDPYADLKSTIQITQKE